MKNTKKVITLSESEIVPNGVYLTHVKDLIQIKKVDDVKKQFQLFNITEQCNQTVDIKNHIIVSRVR